MVSERPSHEVAMVSVRASPANQRSGPAAMTVLALAILLLASGCRRTPPSAPVSDDGRVAEFIQDRDRRERQSAWLQLGEEQRQQIRDAASAYAVLPADERARLHSEFAKLDRAEQRGWLLGPQVGAWWPQLAPLLSYVPEDERAPLLRILQELDSGQLEMLGRIAWRTPPDERDAVRQRLIALAPASRSAWLASMSQR